jgi:uracil-DNA glycosylase
MFAQEQTEDWFRLPPATGSINSDMNTDNLPASWEAALAPEFDKPYWSALTQFVDSERATETVFPPDADVLNALRLTPYEKVRVFVLGQDPYHDDNQAHGLAFSVRPVSSRRPRLPTFSRS